MAVYLEKIEVFDFLVGQFSDFFVSSCCRTVEIIWMHDLPILESVRFSAPLNMLVNVNGFRSS